MKLTIVTATFPSEINGVALTFGPITRELVRRGQAARFLINPPDSRVAAAAWLDTYSPLRTRLAGPARVTIEPHSWANVIARFEADLLGVINLHPTP